MRYFKRIILYVCILLVIYLIKFYGRNKDLDHRPPILVVEKHDHRRENIIEIDRMTVKHKNRCRRLSWFGICGMDINSLLAYPLFPHLPSHSEDIELLGSTKLKSNAGYRYYGLIAFSKAGLYHIQIATSSSQVSLLFWISRTNMDKNMNLVLNISRNIMNEAKSIIVDEPGKEHYFDIVIKTSNFNEEFSLKIKHESEKTYEIIDGRFLSYYEQKTDIEHMKDLTVSKSRKTFPELWGSNENIRRGEMFKLPSLPLKNLKNVLPQCPYKPSYLISMKLPSQQGVYETRYISIYPGDDTTMIMQHKTHRQLSYGNDLLDEKIAKEIVDGFLKAYYKGAGRMYNLESVLNVERVADPKKGNRYLLELELSDQKTGKRYLFSKYVYQKLSGTLCFPENFQYKRNAHVNILVTHKNQRQWLLHLINTFSDINLYTNDRDFTLIIADFDSKDVDIKAALEKSSIPNYYVIDFKGKFHKTYGLQTAASIAGKDQILLQVDLHLNMPMDILDVTRKHTILGKAAFSPSVFRLQCGYTPQNPRGFWEISGYGIFAMFKADWDVVGGMNVENFSNRWGGEDWDLLDRVLSAGYEVERIKLRNFYHTAHTKAGMWNL